MVNIQSMSNDLLVVSSDLWFSWFAGFLEHPQRPGQGVPVVGRACSIFHLVLNKKSLIPARRPRPSPFGAGLPFVGVDGGGG